MKARVLIIIVFIMCLFLQGCARFAEKQRGNITSEPDGVYVYFFNPFADQKEYIGTTPVSTYVQQGLADSYIVAEKSGYKTEQYLLPRSGDISHHFILERSYSWKITQKITQEAPNFSKQFKKDVANVLGTFDKVLNSPRMLASSVVSDARTQIQELVIDYPEHSNSETIKGLKELLNAADYVTSLSSVYYDSATERDGARAVRELISNIKTGLGLNI